MKIDSRDIRTKGYVLRRTNYGEADRILNIITPKGKISAIAKGVRKEKSKLAGGIEMFSLVDFNVHFGRKEMGTITGAKMIKYYGGILKDFDKLEFAGVVLKDVGRMAESSDSADYFDMVDQCFKALDLSEDIRLIESWFILNLKKVSGEEVNLYRDNNGNKLKKNNKYEWDGMEREFVETENGRYGENEIKMLRLMITMDLNVIQRIKLDEMVLNNIFRFAKSI